MIRSDELANRGPGDPSDELEAAGSTHVSPRRLASFWGVHVRTVYRDIEKGALPASRLPGGRLRIRVVEARRYGRPIE